MGGDSHFSSFIDHIYVLKYVRKHQQKIWIENWTYLDLVMVIGSARVSIP